MKKQSIAVISIVVATAVVVVGIVAVVVLNRAGGRVATEVEEQLTRAIEEAGLQDDLSFSDVDVDVAQGRLSVEDIAFTDTAAENTILADSVSVTVPRGEAIDFARNPGSATLSEIDVDAERLSVTSLADGTTVSFADIDVEADGEIDLLLFQQDPQAAMRDITSFDLDIRDMTITPSESMRSQMGGFVGNAPWLADESNWGADSVSVSARTADGTVTLERFDVSAPLLTFEGTGTLRVTESGEATPERIELQFQELDPGLRSAAAPMMLFMMGLELPADGPFTMVFAAGPDGRPRFSIE